MRDRAEDRADRARLLIRQLEGRADLSRAERLTLRRARWQAARDRVTPKMIRRLGSMIHRTPQGRSGLRISLPKPTFENILAILMFSGVQAGNLVGLFKGIPKEALASTFCLSLIAVAVFVALNRRPR